MYPNSKELAERIDVLVAFQNDEEIEHRSIGSKGTAPWVGKYGNSPQSLSFNFNDTEYRVKSTIIEGYVRPYNLISENQKRRCASQDTFIHVKEVLSDAT